MSSPPTYTLLPASSTPPDPEKAPHSTPPPFPSHAARSTRARAYALALGGLISAAVLVVLLYAGRASGLMAMACGSATASSWAGLTAGTDEFAVADQDGEGKADELPAYSTSVYENGETSSFVYTTRPIINPGGYTIGTFVGYQHISSPTAAPPSPTSPEAHWRQKRGFDLEDDAGPSPTPTREAVPAPHTDGATEFSYARERNGEVGRYVKTTRPIVNPVGFTIGSLDGAYVRVGTHTPAPTIRVVEQWSHQELRRRDLVEA